MTAPQYTPDHAPNSRHHRPLEALGFRHLTTAHWLSFKPVDGPTIFECENVCWCGNTPKRVSSIPFGAGPRPILIGRCSQCFQITCSYWTAPTRTWTGPRTLSARPMYTQGQGA